MANTNNTQSISIDITQPCGPCEPEDCNSCADTSCDGCLPPDYELEGCVVKTPFSCLKWDCSPLTATGIVKGDDGCTVIQKLNNSIGLSNFTFRNGLSRVGTSNNIELGLNPLLHDTIIPLSTYELSINSTDHDGVIFDADSTTIFHSDVAEILDEAFRAKFSLDSIVFRSSTFAAVNSDVDYLAPELIGIYKDYLAEMGINVPTSHLEGDRLPTNTGLIQVLLKEDSNDEDALKSVIELYSDRTQLTQIPNTRDDSEVFSPLTFLYTDTEGYIRTAPISLISEAAANNIDARNGLHKPANFVELGGPLIYDTLISDNTFTLQIENHTSFGPEPPSIADNSSQLYVSRFGTTGRKAITSNMSLLTSDGNAVDDYITTATESTLYVYLNDDALDIDVSNVVSTSTYTLGLNLLNSITGDYISNIRTIISLSNNDSITTEDNDIEKLAGIVIGTPAQSITGDDYTGTIGESTGLLIKNQKGGIPNATVEKTYAIKQTGDNSNLFEGHVTISDYADPESSTSLSLYPLASDRPRLSVSKVGAFSTIPANTGADFSMSLVGSGSDNTSTTQYSGAAGTLFWEYTSNQALLLSNHFSGVIGNLVYESDYDTTVGMLSGVSSNGIFTPKTVGTHGTLSKFANFRARTPRQAALQYSQGKIFAGIADVYGFYIEDQRADGSGLPITNSWGVYQLGASDKNYLQAKTGIGTSSVVTSAKFQVDHTVGSPLGSLPAPRVTTTERNAIPSPIGGLLVYNTTAEEYQYYKTSTSSWISL